VAERIRAPHYPEDDTPFGGERWGCFWLIFQVAVAWLLLILTGLFITDPDWRWWLRSVVGLLLFWQIGSYFRRKLRR
jgi:hypothetical protein